MMKFISSLSALAALVAFAPVALSANTSSIDNVRKTLSEKLPDLEITQIKTTPIDGVFEVMIGPQIVYIDEGARYVIDGDMIDLATRENISEQARAVIRNTRLDELGENNMIVYSPEKVKHAITVVTDINCPYCRRLHSEMGEYMKSGVKVRYIFMPLKGPDDFAKTVSVWCSEDKNKALDLAKSGGDIKPATCENPIERHLELARQIGARGTPAIILEDGKMFPGYVPVAKLVQKLDELKSQDTP